MAKGSKKAAAGEGGKSSRRKSLKRAVAKVPKQVRRTGTKAQRLVEEHTAISEAVAAGLLAAAAALAGDKKNGKGKTALKAALGAIGSRLLAEVEQIAGIGNKGEGGRGKGKRGKGSNKRGGKGGEGSGAEGGG